MLLFEVKKILFKTLNKSALLILIAVLVIGSFLTIRDVKYTDANGNSFSGISAARHLKEDKNQWKGYIDEDVLKNVIRKNQEIISSPSALSVDVHEKNKVYAKSQNFADIKEIINLAFSEFDNYDPFKADNISEEEVKNLYKQRMSELKSWLNSEEVTNTFSADEKEWLIHKYESLKTPLYYEYADGWKALLDSQYLPTLMMITILIIGIIVSGVFSDEFSWKAESIFFSTKLGRKNAILSKIGAGLLISTILYWGIILTFSLIVLSILGFSGGSCAVQTGVSNWNSIYNITYFQDFLISVFGGYVGCLFITTLAMLVSAKTHSTVFAITIPFILTCLPPFIGRIEIFARIVTLFPDQLLQLNKNLESFSLYHIGGNIVSSVALIIPLYLVLFFLLLPILYIVYAKTQIK